MNKFKKFYTALAVICLMMLLLPAVLDRPVTATDVKTAPGNLAFTEYKWVLVDAQDHTTEAPLEVVAVDIGTKITITAGENDTWTVGPGEDRKCNANGCPKFSNFGAFKYGVLKGRIGYPAPKWTTEWFFVGTSYTFTSPAKGWLYLACHDSPYDDNDGSISVKVEVVY